MWSLSNQHHEGCHTGRGAAGPGRRVAYRGLLRDVITAKTRTMVHAEAFSTSSVNGLVTNVEKTKNSFTTDVQHLRIEDTDAYGIMYNGNYLKHYARALESIKEVNNIVGFETMRFSGSPSLGEAFVIRGIRTEPLSPWNLSLESAENHKEYNCLCGLVLGENICPSDDLVKPPFDHSTSTECLHLNQYTVFRDEFEHNNHLSLATMLNYFERPRSQSLGGAKGLSKLRDDGILAVVTRIDNLQLWSTNDVDLVPGDTIHVRSYAMLRRKSMIRFKQIVFFHDKPLAHGEISVMLIDSTTKRPRPLPDWALREVFVTENSD